MERESQVAIIWDQHIILIPKRWTELTSQVTKSLRLGVARPPLQARTEFCSLPTPNPVWPLLSPPRSLLSLLQ